MDATFSLDPQRVITTREAFEKSLEAARSVTELSSRFQEVPPEFRTKASEAFTAPPAEFQEYDVQKRLLMELDTLTTLEELSDWYQRTKNDRDRVVSQTLRNILLDRIREKKTSLLPPQDLPKYPP